MKSILQFLAVAGLLSVLAARVPAQVATGTPPLGTVDSSSGPDAIDLANLNAHIAIPVIHKSGRGTDFTYDLSYDSSVWDPVTVNGITTWTPAQNYGWRGQTEVTTGYISYSLWIDSQPHCVYYYYQNWVYHDSWGVPHPFTGEVASAYTGGNSQYCGSRYFQGFSDTAPDGSGYSITVPSNSTGSFPGATLYGRDGKVYSVPFNTGSGTGNFTDRNGNEITVNSTGNFYDTTSSTNAVLTVSGSGSPTSPIKFTYTAPSNGQASYTLNYTNYTVATNFGISGINEYNSGSTPVPLVTSVVLPDGSQYTIQYEATPSTPSSGACTPVAGTTCVTGRITSITLPTGGSITYTYLGGYNGVFRDGSTSGLKRVLSNGSVGPSWSGTWQYSRSLGSGAASTDVITDPLGNVTTMQFQGIYETQRVVNDVSLGLLETVNTCYNGAASPCTGTAVSLPISSRTAITILPGSKNLQSEVATSYNSYGNLTEEDDYDFGQGAPGSLLRKKLITLQTVGTYNAIQTAKIEDGSGTLHAETQMTFDEGSVTPTSGTPQHQNPTVGRGNPTTINYYRSGLQYLTKTLVFFDTGNVQSVTDVNNATTTYTYSNSTATCGNSFPTGVNEAISGLGQTYGWNCTGGVLTSATDENGKVVSTSYTDADFWRPASVTDPLNNQTTFSYQPNPTYCCPPLVASFLNFNSGNSEVSDLKYYDGLGRIYVDQRLQNPTSSTLDSISYIYDSNNRLYSASMPCSVAHAVSCSTPTTTQTYDALGRPRVTTDGGQGTVTYSYSQNDVLVTLGPAPSKSRQLEYDGLGRLTSACEITSGTGSGTCGQTNPQTGYWTKYGYDTNGNLTSVTQNAQSTPQQTRSYAYDYLSRLIQETNPENGTTYYAYDFDPGVYGSANCSGTYSGDLVKIVDAVGNVVCNTYDALHRNTSTTYPAGTYASVTPSKYFVYDAATVNNVPMAYPKARLAEAYTCFSPCSSKVTDLGLSYTVRGETSDTYESTLHSGGYYHSSTSYWANGVPQYVQTTPGSYWMNYLLDGEGRIASTNGGGNYLTGTIYNPAGQITQMNFSSGDSDTYSYDPNTGRMTQYQFNVGALHQAMTGMLTWNANGSLQNLNIQDLNNNVGTQSCNYQHDDLSRISNVSCVGSPLQNPGFEGGNVDWNLSGSWSIVNNAANAQSGSWYLSGSSTAETNAQTTVNGSTYIPVTPGELITFGGWIKRTGGTGVLDWGCVIYDANHNWAAWCTAAGSGDGSGGTSWQLYTAQVTVPSNGAYIVFFAEIHGWGDTDSSLTSGYFDSAFMDGVSIWNQGFTYDAFGNLTKSGSGVTYSLTTNHIASIGTQTPTYDANGNVTYDVMHQYSWDANGRPVSIDGIGVTYDALGRMVEQYKAGTYSQLVYSTTGTKLAVTNGQTFQTLFVPLVGGSTGVIPNGGSNYWTHLDWLGSARLATYPNQTVAGDVAYGPFGETYASSGAPLLSYTGMDQQTSSNLYDFPAREYGIQGRWPSPDPAGLASVDPTNPQSWNRYAYALNDPLRLTDPSGEGPELLAACSDPFLAPVCAIAVVTSIIEFFKQLFDFFSPPPEAAPAPPGGYGAGIDPYGTWDEKLPAGVQALPSSVPGGAAPGGSGCTYGQGGLWGRGLRVPRYAEHSARSLG